MLKDCKDYIFSNDLEGHYVACVGLSGDWQTNVVAQKLVEKCNRDFKDCCFEIRFYGAKSSKQPDAPIWMPKVLFEGTIHNLNEDNWCVGIIPILSPGCDLTPTEKQTIYELVAPDKDIAGLRKYSSYINPMVLAAKFILESFISFNPSIKHKPKSDITCTIYGTGNIITKLLTNMLLDEGYAVGGIDENASFIAQYEMLSKADFVFLMGHEAKKFLKTDLENAVGIIDFPTCIDDLELSGGLNPDSFWCFPPTDELPYNQTPWFYTPVPDGIELISNIILLRSAIISAERCKVRREMMELSEKSKKNVNYSFCEFKETTMELF